MNFVAKIGRNQPCPCGSGKKYKRCCAGKAQSPKKREPMLFIEDDGLDDLSNSVLDLIEERRFAEALAACQRLLVDFPDVHDGLDRSGLVHAAMGNHALAAHFFRKAHDFAADPVRRADYDDELLDDWRLQAEEQDRLAAEAERASDGEQERAP